MFEIGVEMKLAKSPQIGKQYRYKDFFGEVWPVIFIGGDTTPYRYKVYYSLPQGKVKLCFTCRFDELFEDEYPEVEQSLTRIMEVRK
jgi:hypothetical protein